LSWNIYFCPDASCSGKVWLVQRCPDGWNVWWVTDRLRERPHVIVASAPLCPICGARLLTAIEYVSRADEAPVVLETRRWSMSRA